MKNKSIKIKNKMFVHIKNATTGITLIALIITIIVLLILAGITISLTLGENGLLDYVKEAKVKTEEEVAREKLELVLLDLQAKKHIDATYNETDYIDKEIEENGMEVEGDIVFVNGWQFQIDRSVPKIVSGQKDIQNKSLIGKIASISTSGYHKIKVTTKTGEEAVYNVHVINYNENLVLDGETQIEGTVLDNKIYELGNKETDVATENEDAKNMVVLKVNGELIIEEGVTLTTCKSDDGYGGPKGMLIYCTGTITNKGTISMTARGARAEGENVYLWQNEDESFEYVPALGANGGERVYNSGNVNGIAGNNGNNRTTGGGGSGGARGGYSGVGGNGTSYSGGTGGRRGT